MRTDVKYEFFTVNDSNTSDIDDGYVASGRYDYSISLHELSVTDIQEKACQINSKEIFLNLLKQLNSTFDNPIRSRDEGNLLVHAYNRGWLNDETFFYWKSHGIYVPKVSVH